MTTASYVPKRGDVVRITFNPQAGHEQAGRRPAFVVSPFEYNRKVGLALLCPITSRAKGYPFEVGIPEGHPVEGVILSDQAKSLDWKARSVEFLCHVGEPVTSKVVQKLQLLLTT